MKKIYLLFFALILAGCAAKPTDSLKGDFCFSLPNGFSIENVTDCSCSIVSADSMDAIGGVEITGLKKKDLKDKSNKNILLYLQNDFHHTNDVEFQAFHWDEGETVVSITLKKQESGKMENFSHLFFMKNGSVYHLWLNRDLLDEEVCSEIQSDVLSQTEES